MVSVDFLRQSYESVIWTSHISFWRLFFTRKLKAEFDLLLYSLVRTVVHWEPLDTCISDVWALCMHRWFLQIVCCEFSVSWMSLTDSMCISKLVCNSAADLRWPGTLRLTAQGLCDSPYLGLGSPEHTYGFLAFVFFVWSLRYCIIFIFSFLFLLSVIPYGFIFSSLPSSQL